MTDPKQDDLPQATPDKAVKYGKQQGKPRMSLVPPNAVRQVAAVMTYGEAKYAAWNYLNGEGLPFSDYLDAAERHLSAFNCGEDLDPESGLPHLAHAAACILMLMEMQLVHPQQDDRCKAFQKATP